MSICRNIATHRHRHFRFKPVFQMLLSSRYPVPWTSILLCRVHPEWATQMRKITKSTAIWRHKYWLSAKHLTMISLCEYIICRAFATGNIFACLFYGRLEKYIKYGRKRYSLDVYCTMVYRNLVIHKNIL